MVGDRPADLRAALDFLSGLELIITTGGLGPTADDLTAEVVAEFAGRPLELDAGLEERIWAIISALRGRWRDVSDESLRAGNRKQALVPRGAAVLEPVGTAPGLVVPVDGGPCVVVLPGPPGELQPMWEVAVATPGLREILARAGTLEQRIMRITGVPESQLASVLRELAPPSSLEITTCLRRGELEIATVFAPDAAESMRRWRARSWSASARGSSRATGRRSTTIVAGLLAGPPVQTVAVAESCTGGLMAGRLTDRAGSSAYVLGGVVAYSNEAKVSLADVPEG